MSHDVRFYMKYSTVFSPVNTIITRIVLRVLLDNQKKTKIYNMLNQNMKPTIVHITLYYSTKTIPHTVCTKYQILSSGRGGGICC